ncbi:MAG: hypothetical protein V3U87_09220 [Methylococcaceae bacterium]
MKNHSKNRVLSSPNKMVWSYFSALRRMCYQVKEHSSDGYKKEDAALCVITAITVVEVFLNVYFRILISEKSYKHAEEKIQNDLKRQVSLDRKLKEWPEEAFGKKINFGSGAGQKFMELKDLRNRLVHFSSTWETIEMSGVTIHGLADTSAFESLGDHSAIQSLKTTEEFLVEVFRLRGIKEADIPGALHSWTGLPSGLQS